MPVLAVWTPEGGLLGAVAPLGLALSAGTALVIDLDPLGPAYPGDRSLADLVAESPRRQDLDPGDGVAVLRNGGVDPVRTGRVVEALVESWPSVVLRLPPRPQIEHLDHPRVPVVHLIPGGWFRAPEGPAVYQATPSWSAMPAPGVRLPVPARGTVHALLTGRRPGPGDRWIRAWRSVWRVPWGQ